MDHTDQETVGRSSKRKQRKRWTSIIDFVYTVSDSLFNRIRLPGISLYIDTHICFNFLSKICSGFAAAIFVCYTLSIRDQAYFFLLMYVSQW